MSIKYSDSGFLDGADETKKLSFDVSGVTTGTTRTITMPDGDTKLYTGDGTSGQILTSGGVGVAPTFQTAAGGGKVLQVAYVNPSKTSTVTVSGNATQNFVEISSDLRIVFTPLSATSKLYFDFSAPIISPNSAKLYASQFYNITSSSAVNEPPSSGSRRRVHWSKRITAFDANDNDMINMQTVEASSNTTVRTYSVYFHIPQYGTMSFWMSPLSTGDGTISKPLFKITEVEV